MKKSPFIALFLLVCLLSSVPALRAADAEAKPETPDRSKFAPQLLTIDFPGGSLQQLVTMAKAQGVAINIIGDPGEMNTLLPAFSLQNASTEIFGRALGQFLESRGLQLIPSGLVQPGVRDVYTVRRFSAKNPRQVSGDAFEPFQIGPYLEQQKVDDIVGAIRTAWEMDPAHDANALRIKFHQPTSILIVSGPSEAIQVAAKIVGTLKRPVNEKVIYQKTPPPETR